MKLSASEFKKRFDKYMQKVYQDLMIVERSGELSVVLEDFYWGMKAEQAAKEGFLGPEESEKRLREYAERVGLKKPVECLKDTVTIKDDVVSPINVDWDVSK